VSPKRTDALLAWLGTYKIRGAPPCYVTGVSHHSAAVGEGELFCALVGALDDGHLHVAEAAGRGAAAVVVERPVDVGLPQIIVPDSREALGLLAAAWHGFPSRQMAVVGVTGTNGKTTTAVLIRAILSSRGEAVGLVSSVGYAVDEEHLEATHTTPEAPVLQSLLARMRDAGIRYAVVEVSSHALALHRVTGTTFAAAVYTNLSRDHLDFHGSMRRYLAAKARLMRLLAPGGVVIANADDPWLAGLPLHTAPRAVTYSPSGRPADVRCVGRDRRERTLQVLIRRGALQTDLVTRLVADFNVANITAAAATVLGLGVAPEGIARGVQRVRSVPGRFQIVDEGQPFAIAIDYAHTPDALARCLAAARRQADGRVLAVFGCGGDRDRGKRPLMAKVVSTLADVAIQTTDNPRREDPEIIFRQAEAGLASEAVYRRIPDRRAAVRRAVAMANPGDVVLAAGKGHERVQILARRRVPYREEATIRRALRDVGYGAAPKVVRRQDRVLVVGLARAGTAAALLLAAQGARVVGTDLRPRKELGGAQKLQHAGVELHTGGHPPQLLDRVDLVVASPGIPPENPLLTAAYARDLPVVDELEISHRSWAGPLIAVTGTNGKTTTARLLGHLLHHAGIQSTVAGNVGYPLASAVLDGRTGVGVVEVSSFQLERSPSLRPRIAVLLNVAPDHLDRHGSWTHYLAAKEKVTSRQTARDFLVYNRYDGPIRQIARRTRARCYPFGVGVLRQGAFVHEGTMWINVGGITERILPLDALPLPGPHNVANTLAACLAAGLLGVDPEHMAEAIALFEPSPHRLEKVADLDGVLFINDSKGTNPHAVESALRSVSRPTVLVAGGRFKGGDLARLVRLVRVRCKAVVLFGEAAPMLSGAFSEATPTRIVATLHEAVQVAHSVARPGDAVLLSPACASFDMFRDYEHRGEEFRREVMLLKRGL
jgi:UDP-N-acetylmuramoylalanine--D-glutamate ligase